MQLPPITPHPPEVFPSFTSGDYSQNRDIDLREGSYHLQSKGGNKGGNFSTVVVTENQGFRDKGGNLEDADIWLSRRDVEALLGVSHVAIKKACKRGKYRSILVNGNGGFQYRIALSSLSPQAQIKWIEQNKEAAFSLSEHIKNKLSPQAQWEIIKLSAPKESSNGTILNESAKEKLAKKIELVHKALSVPPGWKKSKWIEHVAEEAGITSASLYEAIKRYKEGGVNALIKTKEKKGPTAWSHEALDYMQGVYLKAIRLGGDATKLKAYEATIAESKKQGWRIGSKSSAYEYLSKLNPLLEKYARGGTRALDNVFYIIRDYKDLSPFEIIVGDQHRFDFWVHDREHNRVFRPEGYFWLDLRTRVTYGFSIGERYDSYFMGLALRMGLKRFGKFGCAYTDNGKPEISKYINDIIFDLKVYGMSEKDISELYRYKDGYIIEGDEGEVIDVVSSLAAWRKYARPYNAKAKLIERYFQTLEKIMLDLGVPGHIKELKGTSEEKSLSDKRLKSFIEEGKLLSTDEFIIKVFEAVEIYEHRRHASIKKSPLDELLYAVKEEGFIPRMIVEPEIDFILTKREKRSVNRGRIRIEGLQYEGKDLQNGIWDIPDKTKIEVRYDPFELDRCIVIKPDGMAVELNLVTISSMKDPELTSSLMERKRKFIAEIKEHFKRLTAPIKGIIEYSKYTKVAMGIKKEKEKKKKFTPEEYEHKVKQIINDSMEYERRINEPQSHIPEFLPERKIFKDDYDRYKYLIHRMLAGYELTEADRIFMEIYEERMDDSERVWWDELIKNHKRIQQRRAGC